MNTALGRYGAFASPLEIFAGYDIEDLEQEDINEVLEDALDDEYWEPYVAFTYAQDVSETNLAPRFMRTSITFAGPIVTGSGPHYSTEDREEIQMVHVR